MKNLSMPYLAPFNDPDGIADLICHTLNELTVDELSRKKVADWDTLGAYQQGLLSQLNSPQIGLHLALIPSQYGGLGLTLQQLIKVTWKLASIDLALATTYMASLLGLGPIIMGGNDKQREYWLSRVAEEGLTGALAATEPDSGSNLAAITTKAEPCTNKEGEQGYLLNGAKQFISNGSLADFYLVLASTPLGPSMFAVWSDTPGLEFGLPENKLGIRASTTSSISFSQVFLPGSSLVGDEGAGLELIQGVFAQSRILTGALALGAAEQAITTALDFAATRKSGNTPLLQKQGYINKLLVESAVELLACQSYLLSTASRFPDLSQSDQWIAAAGAKLLCTETGFKIVNRSLQAMGGYGYMRDYGVEKILRDSRILTIYEGTSEILQNMVAAGGIRSYLKTSRRSTSEQADDLLERLASVGPDISPKASDSVRWTAETLHLNRESLKATHTNRLTRNQHLLFALADSMVLAEASEALCDYLLKKYEAAPSGSPQSTPPQKPLSPTIATGFPWKTEACCARIFARSALMEAMKARAMVLGFGEKAHQEKKTDRGSDFTELNGTHCALFVEKISIQVSDLDLASNLWTEWLEDYDMVANGIFQHYSEHW